MKKLLADLDKNAGKTAWQTNTVKHGIETFEVLVPVKNATLFEAEMKKPLPNKQTVLTALRTCGGELK